jgi:NAD(P)-dependent dehydrogenase (short-subunit alcohol dehydrogenase family)
VHVSAVVAERPLPGMAAYSASKAALSGVATALRTELRRAGGGRRADLGADAFA